MLINDSVIEERLTHLDKMITEMYKLLMGNNSDGLKVRVAKLESSLKYLLVMVTALGGCLGGCIGWILARHI